MPEEARPGGGASNSASQWFQKSLERVIGLSASEAAGLPGAGVKSEASLRALARRIDQRFRRVVDPRNGNVSFETAGGALLPLDAGGDIDEAAARLARSYVGAARAAIESIDPNIPLPRVHPDEITSEIGPITTALDALEQEASSRGNRIPVTLWMTRLTARKQGMLPSLKRLLTPQGQEPRSIEWERALHSVTLAETTLESFKKALRHMWEEETPVSDTVHLVRRCAHRVNAQVEEVRARLGEVGIGELELGDVKIELRGGVRDALDVDDISLSEALRLFSQEPERWASLLDEGAHEWAEAVWTSARTLAEVAEQMEPQDLSTELQLEGDEAERVEADLRRLQGLVERVCGEITALRPQPPQRPARGGGGRRDRQAEVPAPDAAGL